MGIVERLRNPGSFVVSPPETHTIPCWLLVADIAGATSRFLMFVVSMDPSPSHSLRSLTGNSSTVLAEFVWTFITEYTST